jgi:hypothetical protein
MELESSLFDLLAIWDPLSSFFLPNGVFLSSLEVAGDFLRIINLLQQASHDNLISTSRNRLKFKKIKKGIRGYLGVETRSLKGIGKGWRDGVGNTRSVL